MRQSLRTLLEREDDLHVCGEAPSAEDALEGIEREQPDLALIDVSLPGMNGIQLVRALQEECPGVALAMLSGHGGAAHVEQALRAGARGYILKGRAAELPSAIRQLVTGVVYVSSEIDWRS